MERLTERLRPQRQQLDDLGDLDPLYLDDSAIDTPPVASACATREAMRLGDIVETMLRDLKRINSHLPGVAYPIAAASGLLRQTRLKK